MAFRVKPRKWGEPVVFFVDRPEEARIVLPHVMDYATQTDDREVTLVGPLDPNDDEHMFDVHKGEGKNEIHYYSRRGRRV